MSPATGKDDGSLHPCIPGHYVFQRITHRGLRTLLDFSRDHPAGIRGFLPNGIAVGPDGVIYLDTYAGNGYSAKTALIAVRPGGQVRVLWQS